MRCLDYCKSEGNIYLDAGKGPSGGMRPGNLESKEISEALIIRRKQVGRPERISGLNLHPVGHDLRRRS